MTYPGVVRAPIAGDVRFLERLRAQKLCADHAGLLGLLALRAAASRWHVLLIGSLATDLSPCCPGLQPLLLPCSAVKVPRLTGVSGLEICFVEKTVSSLEVSEATDAPNAA